MITPKCLCFRDRNFRSKQARFHFLSSKYARKMLCSGYEISMQPVDPFRAGVLINNCHNFASGGLVN